MTKATKSKTRSAEFQLARFTYWIRCALKELETMPPELRESLGKVIGDCDLTQVKDLDTLITALRKMSLS